MKYLKLYESMATDMSRVQVEELFSPYMNWDMIADAKDMSLEYLDKGLELEMIVTVNHIIIYEMYFSHNDSNSSQWCSTNQYDVNHIDYYFDFSSPSNRYKSYPLDTSLEEDLSGFLDRLKEVYPSEKIHKSVL